MRSVLSASLCIGNREKGDGWRRRTVHPKGRTGLHTSSHGYFHPIRHSQQWASCMQDYNSLHPRSHSWSIVCLWRPTISRFSHVRQSIPQSLRLLDSALVVWICRRAEAGGTMPYPCPALLIKPIHKSKILPTATSWDNKGLSSVRQLRLCLSSIHLTCFVCTPLMGVTLKMSSLPKSIQTRSGKFIVAQFFFFTTK